MNTYTHKVQYYETDKMGVVHHSNYIRWMEEARVAFLDENGYGYVRLEADGIISPVTGIECQYKRPVRFGDAVMIRVTIAEYRGVRLVIRYEMTDAADGSVVLTGSSMHCFTDAGGRPIILKKHFPAFDGVLRCLAAKDHGEEA